MNKAKIGGLITGFLQLAHIPLSARATRQIERRFDYNSGFSDWIMGVGFIYGQRGEPQSGLKIGIGSGGARGCGPFAIYNALRLLGFSPDPAVIIRELDYMGGFNLGGLGGTNPAVMADFLRKTLLVKIDYLPESLDALIAGANVSILLYHAGGMRLHYVTVVRMADGFQIYNLGGNDVAPRLVESIDEWQMGVRILAAIVV
ncbi:MAG: hypothetical protein FWG65_04090 [Turicibacter sp.]|nr:hypothetical protein [Turicibacter sp.]